MAEKAAQRDLKIETIILHSQSVSTHTSLENQKKLGSTRTIQQLIISNPDESNSTLEKEEVASYLQNFYKSRLLPKPNAGRMSIQTYLGPAMLQSSHESSQRYTQD